MSKDWVTFRPLTTGIDNFTASGNAIFEATIGTIGNNLASTFTPYDQLTGNGTEDILNVYTDVVTTSGSITQNINGTFPVGAKVSGVEIVNIFNQGNTAANVTDASKYTGVEQLWQYSLAQSVTKVGDNTAVGFGGVSNMTAANADNSKLVSATFTGTQATIALDEVATGDGGVGGAAGQAAFRVGVEGSKLTTLTIGGSLDNQTASTETGYTGYGRLQITSTGLSKLETVNLALTTDADLATYSAATTALVSTVKTIDGSASTGGLNLGLSGAATNNTAFETISTGSGKDRVALLLGANSTDLTVSLGDGDDRLTLDGNSVLTSSQISVDGGEGTDTLAVTGALAKALYASTTKTTLSGFETLRISALADATNANKLTGYENIVIAGAVSGGAGDLFNVADDSTITFDGDLGAAAALIMLDATGTTDTMNLVFRGVSDSTAQALTVADVETVNIESTGATSSARNDLKLVAGAAKTLTVSGANELELVSDTAALTKVTSVDATALTAKFTVDLTTATQGVTVTVGDKGSKVTGSAYGDLITGGNGADNLIGAVGADTITAGQGTDTVEGGTGADLLTGGAGPDDFVQQAGKSVAATTATGAFASAGTLDGNATITFANGVDVITDFTVGDDDIITGVEVDFKGYVTSTAVVSSNFAKNDQVAIRGTWDSTTGKFSYAAGGSDALVVTDVQSYTPSGGSSTTDLTILGVADDAVIVLGVAGNLTSSDFLAS